MPKMYKGRLVKDCCEIVTEERHGQMYKILRIPSGCKNPYVDETKVKEKKRQTTTPNPDKDKIIASVIPALRELAEDKAVKKTATGKYVIKLNGKWYSFGVTANGKEPKTTGEV